MVEPATPPAAVAGTLKLGDLTVNRLGFGAMRVAGPDVWGEPKDRAGMRRLLVRAFELGHNFFDTADSYGPDVSEILIAEALHPSAAVGGTPTPTATALISEIEGMDRGRYAGPVGWMDAAGDGEWGIGLRSAEVNGPTVRLFAGCGIVGDSDPEAELAESQAKFVPVRDALVAD